MSTFLLVHGAWNGGWCWSRLAPLLEQLGHKAIAPDLPAHGSDVTPVDAIRAHSYADAIVQMVDQQDEPVVLVGHSMGGIVISQVAEKRPNNVTLLVYLAAYLAPAGASLADMLRQDYGSLLRGNIVLSEDKRTSTLRPEIVREAIYTLCPDEDFNFAIGRMRPEPVAPSLARLELSDGNYGSVPRVYIECLRDRAVSLGMQQRMHTALPCRRVVSLDTDHSPFFSAPRRLAAALDDLARESSQRSCPSGSNTS